MLACPERGRLCKDWPFSVKICILGLVCHLRSVQRGMMSICPQLFSLAFFQNWGGPMSQSKRVSGRDDLLNLGALKQCSVCRRRDAGGGFFNSFRQV